MTSASTAVFGVWGEWREGKDCEFEINGNTYLQDDNK
jgi:hypothetical protein